MADGRPSTRRLAAGAAPRAGGLTPEAERAELEQIVRHCLDRGLFTREEAMARIAQPDVSMRPGAQLLRQMLDR